MRILFVCEGNINRSQMAGTIFKSLVPSAEVKTAGVLAERAGETLGEGMHRAVPAMKKIGLDMSANVIIKLTPAMVEEAEKVILLGPILGAPVPTYLEHSPKLETWSVPDPGYGQATPEEVRDIILKKVQDLVTRLGLNR